MPGLRELQRALAAYLLEPAPRAAPPQVTGGVLSPAERLNIHRNNTFITLREALVAVYPVVHQLVGEAFFADLARGFVRRYPCRSGNLHGFGRDLDTWLAGDARLRALPYLPDVARLEWAVHVAFHAADAVALDVERLRDLAAEQLPALRLKLVPGCTLLYSAYPVLSIWRAHQGGGPLPRVDAGCERVLVARSQLEVEFHALDTSAFTFLCAVRNGQSLECATEAALELDDDFDLQAELARHLASGIFADLRIEPGAPPVNRAAGRAGPYDDGDAPPR